MLREAVRRVHMAEYHEDHITTEEMDRIIESIGPETREKMIKFMEYDLSHRKFCKSSQTTHKCRTASPTRIRAIRS